MIRRVVDFALGNRLLVLALALILFAGGIVSFKRQEVVGGNMLPNNLQEVISGLKPGEQVVARALVFQNTVEQ